MDYNYYVDNIIKISDNPFDGKEFIIEILKDIEIMRLYNAYKSDKNLICDNKSQVLEILEKLDSILFETIKVQLNIGGEFIVDNVVVSRILNIFEKIANNQIK